MLKRKLPYNFPSERSVNRQIFPIIQKRSNPITFPVVIEEHDNTTSMTGLWNSKNFMLLDLFGGWILRTFYKKNNAGNIPKTPYDPIIINFLESGGLTTGIPIIKLTAKEIKDKLYYFNITVPQIHKAMLEINNCKFSLFYKKRVLDVKNNKKVISSKGVVIKDSSIANIKVIDGKKSKNGRFLDYSYEIDFNTDFGLSFTHNIITLNVDWVTDNNCFYDLKEHQQLFYRKLIFCNKRLHITIHKIAEKLFIHNKNKSSCKKYIFTILENLKSKGFIDEWESDKHMIFVK